MVYHILIENLKKIFFIISSDCYKNKESEQILERYSCKHPVLTPELIVVNDQPYGFRRMQRKYESLEKFPIQCDMEYLDESDYNDIPILEHFELFSEVKTSLHGKVNSIEQLCKTFEDYINVERIKKIGTEGESTLLIYSKLGEILYENCYEDDIYEGKVSERSIRKLIQSNLQCFVNFILCCDNILFKNKKIDTLDPKLLP